MLTILRKSFLFLIIIDLIIFIRSFCIGIKNVFKKNSSNILHSEIRKRILEKKGKIMIVGCGTSLLDIPKTKLKKLNKEYFTVGMSFACHLNINFDLYYAEFGGKHQDYLKDFYEKILFFPILEAYRNKQIKLLIHKDFQKSYDFFKLNNLNFPKEMTTHMTTGLGIQVKIASKLTRVLKFCGIGFQTSGSLSYITLKMIDYGAKEIVLAGIDLDDKGYFFSDKRWKGKKLFFDYETFFNNEYKKQNKKFNKIHRTNNPDFYKLTMKSFLILIKNTYKKLKIKLLINKGNLRKDFDSIFKY